LKVDRKSPEFRTVHEGVLKRVDIDFASLNFIMHQEALLHLISFANDFQVRESSLIAVYSASGQAA